MNETHAPGPADVDYHELAKDMLEGGFNEEYGTHGFERTIKEVVKYMARENEDSETYAHHKPTRAQIRAMAHEAVDDVFEAEFGVDELSRAKEQNESIIGFEGP